MAKPIPGRIPWLAVISWAQFHHYGRDEIELLDRAIGAMDAVFLAHQKEASG